MGQQKVVSRWNRAPFSHALLDAYFPYCKIWIVTEVHDEKVTDMEDRGL